MRNATEEATYAKARSEGGAEQAGQEKLKEREVNRRRGMGGRGGGGNENKRLLIRIVLEHEEGVELRGEGLGLSIDVLLVRIATRVSRFLARSDSCP